MNGDSWLDKDMKQGGMVSQILQRITELENFMRRHQAIQHGVVSGTWIPAGTAGTNVAAVVPSTFHYLSIGKEVFFHGLVQIDLVVIGAGVIYLSLVPALPSVFTAAGDASGSVTNPGVGIPNMGSLREEIPAPTSQRLQVDLYAQTAANTFYRCVGGYMIRP